jgi:hypothetical protein
MLDVARRKPHADRVTWIRASAQTFRTEQRYDLIVMSGHAFQVLLTDAQIATTFAVMREHLASSGRIAFETRNPDMDWARRWHGSTRFHQFEGSTVHQAYKVRSSTAGLVTFDTIYTFPDDSLTSTSSLRFATQECILGLLNAAGLHVNAIFGDWNSGPFDARTSDELIFVASSCDMTR